MFAARKYELERDLAALRRNLTRPRSSAPLKIQTLAATKPVFLSTETPTTPSPSLLPKLHEWVARGGREFVAGARRDVKRLYEHSDEELTAFVEF